MTRTNVTILAVACMLFLASSLLMMVTPLIPHYRDEFEMSVPLTGIFTALHPAGAILSSVPAGLAIARWGPRPMMVTALIGAAIACFGLAFSSDVLMLLASRTLHGISSTMVWVSTFSWLARLAPPGRRGRVIGIGAAAGSVGGVAGPVFGALGDLTSPTIMFGSLGIVLILAAGATLLLESPGPDMQGGTPRLNALWRRREVLAPALLVIVGGLAFGSTAVTAPLRLADMGATGAVVGVAFLIAAVIEAIVSRVIGGVSDRVGHRRPIRIGLLLAPVVLILLALQSHVLPSGAVLVFFMGTVAIFLVPSLALFSTVADGIGVPQSTMFGMTNITWAVGNFAGGLLGGLYVVGPLIPAAIVALAMLALAACVWSPKGPLPIAR